MSESRCSCEGGDVIEWIDPEKGSYQLVTCPVCNGTGIPIVRPRTSEEERRSRFRYAMEKAVGAINVRPYQYILNEKHEVIPAGSLLEWAEFMEKEKQVAETVLGEIRISTVFLGIDHYMGPLLGLKNAPLILFETMVFGGKLDELTERYETWDQAVAGHHEVVARVIDHEERKP